MINGITFSEQLTTSADFAHFQNTFLNNSNGITKGCEISHAAGNVYVQKGYFIICGRFVRVVGMETVPTPEIISGQIYCKVVFEIDLTKINTAEDFEQGYYRVLTSVEAYPQPTQEDLDNDGTLFQMPWCQFIKAVDGIKEFRDLREILDLSSIWKAVSGQNVQYKNEFDTYFESQKNVIEHMIKELQNEGYLLIEDAKRTRQVTLPAAGWSAEAPYTQTVPIEGMTEMDSPIPGIQYPNDMDEATKKAIDKSAGMITKLVTVNGGLMAECKFKKPAVDIPLVLKGV